MNLIEISKIVLIVSIVICLLLLLARLRTILARPLKPDRARPKRVLRMTEREWGLDLETSVASPAMGILYAFSLGMAPWEKESTRLHTVSYVRGMLLHVGIITSLALLVVSLFTTQFWPAIRIILIFLTGLGALGGLGATIWRFIGYSERRLSYLDDYASVILVFVFVALTCWWLIDPLILPWWYFLSSLMLVYIPFSKIRHLIFFFFTRFFFGDHFGRRGVLPPTHKKAA